MKKNDYEHYLLYIPGVRFWIITTGVIVAFAALKVASHIVNIILLATFLTAVSLAPLTWLKKKGLPKILANFIVIISVVVIVGLIGLLIGEYINNFLDKLPFYQEKFRQFWINTVNFLAAHGLIENSDTLTLDTINKGKLLPMAAPIASGFSSIVSGAIIIFILFIFMIMESEIFSKKLMYISAKSSKDVSKIIKQLRNYFGIKTLTSLFTGITIALMLYFIDIEFWVLWGFLAFILNFIPSIGSFIAAIPAVILAFLMHGPFEGFITIIGYFVLNTLIGNVIEPQLMGKNLGISPLIVFFSMIFFGYILGPIGMLIATPLAIIIKIIFDSREVTRNLGILIGNGSELVNKNDTSGKND
jgi:predicted PurR-regulated permease PerM